MPKDRGTCRIDGCEEQIRLSPWTGEPFGSLCPKHGSLKDAGMNPEEFDA